MKTMEHDGRTYFDGWAGLDLYFTERHPAEESKASVILLHGYAEHSGRYNDIAELFCKDRCAVYTFDQRGHGRSEGVRCDVVRFSDYVRDIATFVDYVRDRSAGKKIFVVAHSIGASVAVLYSAANPEKIDGLVTTGIYVRDALEYDRWKSVVAPILASLIPLVPIQELDPSRVALDPRTVSDYRADPLVYHGGVRVRMGLHFIRMERYLEDALRSISIPLFILHGKNDSLASIEGSNMLYERAASADKRLAVLDGVGHDVLHDYSWSDTGKSILEWVDAHL